MSHHTPEQIRDWIQDPKQWPTDSYDLETLKPWSVLAKREAALREAVQRGVLPSWYFGGEAGANLLSIGTGKGYFERKLWGGFDRVYSVDPSEQTRLSLEYFPVRNVQYVGRSLFDLSPHRLPVPKYAWMGACVHYLFEEFHGWEFMQKLAMMVYDTLVIDAGVFDRESGHAQRLLARWDEEGVHQRYRNSQFSYACFREKIDSLWDVVSETETPWIDDGRRTLVLKRRLPPVIQRSRLHLQAQLVKGRNWAVYRTGDGYFKESPHATPLLVHDTVAKVMGWSDFVRYVVYDGSRFCGFVTRDMGDEAPADASASERIHLGLSSWLLPLGLLPSDASRQNIRMRGGEPIWIDIEVLGLRDLDAERALWLTTNVYKEYDSIPEYVLGVNRHSGATQSRLLPRVRSARPEPPAPFDGVVPEGATVLVVSRGDEELLKLEGRRGWHFPQTEDGTYAGHHPGDSEEAIAHLEALRGRGADYLLFPPTSLWWLDHYDGLREHLETRCILQWSGEGGRLYRLAPALVHA